MAVQFIIGRAGSGKTAWCVDRTVEACRADPLGPPVYWITPKQATFQTERDLCCGSGLPGYFRVRVVSFDLLGREILAEVGGGAVPEVNDLGRQMILGHLLRGLEPRLTFFRSVALKHGLPNELAGTFDELERGGADLSGLPVKLAEALATADGADATNTALLSKVRDLELIHRAYNDFLGQDRLDPGRRMRQSLEAIERSRRLQDATIYVDGFHDFGEHDRRILAGCAKVCRSMHVAFTIDPASPLFKNANHLPDEMSLFHRTELAYRGLWFAFAEAGVEVRPPVYLRDVRRFARPALSRLETWTSRGRADAAPVGVELIEAPDRRSEVDAAARKVLDLVAGGLRYRDVAVLARDTDDYHALIDASFAEHGIPFFVDRRRTARHHPLLQFVREALAVAGGHWPQEHLLSLVKSGLAGLSPHEADELENYVLLHGIRGSTWARPEPWTGRRTPPRDDGAAVAPPSADHADKLRRTVMARLRPFVEAATSRPTQTVRRLCSAVFDLLEACKVRDALTEWAAQSEREGQIEQAGEHVQVWTELVALFEQFVDVLGDQQVTLADFTAVLETGLEGFDLALTPPTVDQVLVGQVDRTRTPSVKATIVLGLNEGQFPRPARPDSVLSDADRRTLAARSVDVGPDTVRRALDEEFWGYLAFTRASDVLVATRAAADDAGKLQTPGSLWRRLRDAVPAAMLTAVPREDESSAAIVSTPRQLVTRLMQWVRESSAGEPQTAPAGSEAESQPANGSPQEAEQPREAAAQNEAEPSPWPALYQWLATHPCSGDAVDLVRFRAWRALGYVNAAELDPAVARQLFPAPLKAGVSQLEAHRNCPFQHFLRYGLCLSERGHERVTAQDLSQVCHDVLERLLRNLLAADSSWCDLSPEEIEPMIADIAADVGRGLKGELMLSTARNQYLLRRITKTLAQVVAAQKAAGLRGQFRPAWAKVRFGENCPLPPLRVRTPAGQDVLLSGLIDRVDLIGGGADAAVVDYRLSASALSLADVYWGVSLKLVTDLLALRDGGAKLAGNAGVAGGSLHPAAAFGVQMLRRIRDEHPDDALAPTDEQFHLRVKPRGVFNGRYAPALDSELAPGAGSDVVAVHLKQDGGFGYRDKSDVAEPHEFAALLRHARRRLGEIAGGILAGDVGIRPYRLGRTTPCPRCDYRDVCRFEPSSGYAELRPMKRDEVLRIVIEEAPEADANADA